MGGERSTAHDRLADALLLSHCTGPTLDLGCGPGRLTIGLHKRGTAALGVDCSAAAVALTRGRGGTAIHADIFDPLPAAGCWQEVLLADGNIGIGGDAVRVLTLAKYMLVPGGIVIAETDPPAIGIRSVRLRWETEDVAGEWFPWSRVGADAIAAPATAAGLRIRRTIAAHRRFFALLSMP